MDQPMVMDDTLRTEPSLTPFRIRFCEMRDAQTLQRYVTELCCHVHARNLIKSLPCFRVYVGRAPSKKARIYCANVGQLSGATKVSLPIRASSSTSAFSAPFFVPMKVKRYWRRFPPAPRGSGRIAVHTGWPFFDPRRFKRLSFMLRAFLLHVFAPGKGAART
jgi:hypothetical protein